MGSRIVINAAAVGTLVVGAAALGGCASNGSVVASSGATASVSVATDRPSIVAGEGGSTAAGTSTTVARAASTRSAGGGATGCTGGELSLKIDQASPGMGHASSVLVFTDTGSKVCTLYGYPGADVTDNGQYDFASLMNATRISGAVAVKTVTLSPGSSASAVLQWDVKTTDGEPANAANCPGLAGGYLEITPPGTTETNKSEPPENMCADLEVYPVVAGTAGR